MMKNMRKWIEGIKYDFEIGNVVEAKDTFGTTECVVIGLCYVESRTLFTGTMRYTILQSGTDKNFDPNKPYSSYTSWRSEK